MTNLFDSNQEKSLTQLMSESQKVKLRQAVLEKLVEKKAEEKKEAAPLTEEKAPTTGTEGYANRLREQVSKDNSNRQKVIPEKTDLLAGDESITAGQLRQSNQEMWNRVQASLASLGGGGVGPKEVSNIVKNGGEFVEAAGDSMTGDLFTPAVHITPNSDNRNILYYDTLDSTHELEAKDGFATDFGADWATPVIPVVGNSYYGLMYVDSAPGYPDGRYYASGDESMWYSEDGTVWLPDTRVPKYYYGKLAHNGSGTWVMVKPENQNVAQWSTDHGATWNNTNSGSTGLTQYQNWGGLAYGNGVFVATAQNKSSSFQTVKYSSNGSSWTDASNLGDSSVGQVAWSEDQNLFMIVTGKPASFYYGNSSVWTSADGDSWSAQPAFTDSAQYGLNDVVYGGDKWVAVGNGGNIIHSVNNGQFWETSNLLEDHPEWTKDFDHVDYANGFFVAKTYGKDGAYSSDGINWTPFTTSARMSTTDMVSANGRIFTTNAKRGDTRGKVCWIEPKAAESGSLLFDGSQVATKENLKPLIDTVNEMADNFVYLGLIYSDSEPSTDSDSQVTDGQMWFNSTTANGQLLVRHNDSWATGHSSAGNVDLSGFLPTSGGTLNGQLKMANGQILLSSTGRNINVEFGTAGRLQYSGGTRFQWGNAYSTVFGTLNIEDGTDYVGNPVEGVLDMKSNIIKNVPDPTAGHHAANKSYVDSVIASLQAQIDALTP